jgi:hypothetical protein
MHLLQQYLFIKLKKYESFLTAQCVNVSYCKAFAVGVCRGFWDYERVHIVSTKLV